MTDDNELVSLVHRARDGDTGAWEELIRRFRGLIAAITRSFRLSPDDAADVAQTTWLRLFESIDRVRQPERLKAWIGTTARRECLRIVRMAGRERCTADLDGEQESRDFAVPGHELLGAEEREAVRAAMDTLSEQHRHLLRVLLASPTPPYANAAHQLEMPMGSIGPTRGRAIRHLRRDPRIHALAS